MAYQPNSYKKFVATAATATLVASAIVPVAFANEASTAAFTDVKASYAEAVAFLVENNFAVGKTETQFGVGLEITRGDAALIIAKAAGLMDEKAPASGFSDVPTRGALAVNSLKAAGVVNGTSATSFGWDQPIKRGDAAVMFAAAFELSGNKDNLKFSDVKEKYEAAVAALVDNKVTNGVSTTQFGTDMNIKRGDFAKFVYALKDQIELPSVTPEVVSVSATNLKTVTVNFNTAIDEDSLTDTVTVKNGTTSLTVASTNLSADGKSVVVELLNDVAQSTVLDVEIDGVETADGKYTFEDVTKKVTVKDVTDPSITNIQALNSKTFKIWTSEPLELETNASSLHVLDNIKVNGVKLVGSIAADHGSNEYTVTLGSKLSVGTHTVEIDGYKDFAGFAAPKYSGSISVVSDTAAPEITDVNVVSRSQVKVQFNEPVESLGTLNINGFNYTTGTANADKTVYTINLDAAHYLDLASTVEEVIEYYGTTDAEGNTIAASAKKTFKFSATDDVVAPTASISFDKDNNVVIKFSEKMSVAGKVTIKDSKGNTVKKDVVPSLDNADTFTYEISAADAGLNAVNSTGNYTVTLTDAKDDSVRANKIAETAVTLSANDVVDPQILRGVLTQAHTTKVVNTQTVQDKPAQITLYLTEAMDRATLEDENNYLVSVDGTSSPVTLSSLSGATAVASADAKSVVLTFQGTGTGKATAGATDATDIYALQLKDVAGNILATTPTGTNDGFNSEIDVQPAVAAADLTVTNVTGYSSDAVLVDNNKVKVSFNNPLSIVDPSDFVVTKTGEKTTQLVGVAYELSADGKTVTITLSGNLTDAAKLGNATDGFVAADLYVKAGATKDAFGNSVVADADLNGDSTLDAVDAGVIFDAVSPELKAVNAGNTVDGNTTVEENQFTVTFSEAIKTADADDFSAILNDLIIRDEDGNIANVNVSGIAQDNTTVDGSTKLVFAVDPAKYAAGENTFTVSLPASRVITDAAGNTVLETTTSLSVVVEVVSAP